MHEVDGFRNLFCDEGRDLWSQSKGQASVNERMQISKFNLSENGNELLN